MQFLDAIGLAYFWEKIKNWANSCFFSKEGGEINPGQGLSYIINGEQLDVSKSGNENETIHIFNVDENGMEAISIKKTDGTATQVLMADGSVRTLNTSNGIAGLDANGNVPLANLGNLDTTVAEVVTALPTSNIKRHIYLVKDSDTTNNKYAEYVYTGDISAAYDSTKWEKFGDFRATVDLADYAKKSNVISELYNKKITHSGIRIQYIGIKDGNGSDTATVSMDEASEDMSGLLSWMDKRKLDMFNMNGVTQGEFYVSQFVSNIKDVEITRNNVTVFIDLPTLGNETLGFELSQADATNAGVMSASDKVKLDGISSGATADSAIPTSVIDALN